MCGIVGTINIDSHSINLELLRHRGPDSEGIEHIQCLDQEVILGHTRLAILDCSPAGHQPMRSRNGRWWLTFNGEIYNHLALRASLDSAFRGHSDTETLIELISFQGVEKTLPILNGMFAFAALDTEEHKLYIARDPFGIKPLYFYHQDNRFAFSSEIRALTGMQLLSEFDTEGLRQFLTLRYIPAPGTLWKNIRRCPPGHLIVYDFEDYEIRCSTYLQPVCDRFTSGQEDAVEAYHEALSAAVRRQLLSDVPVGILLSGGIDSALVAAAAKESGNCLPCFTVGFGGSHSECEIEDARETARVLGLPFFAITTNEEELRQALPAIAQAVEEPLGTTSIMPMWYLVKRAREDVTVVLTGQGSDEPWGGYFRYQLELLRQRLPSPGIWQAAKSVLCFWNGKPDSLERGLRSLAASDPIEQIIEALALFSRNERKLLMGDDGDGGATARLGEWYAWLGENQTLSGVERMMRLDTRMNLADDLLLYGDKISMAVALEARVPMLDIELVKFVESLPIEYRIRWRHGKVVHKRMAERYLPREIVHRPKKNFQVPFGSWSKREWRGWIEELLLDGLDGLLNRAGVAKLWQQHLAGKPDRSRQIFALLMLALWRQQNH